MLCVYVHGHASALKLAAGMDFSLSNKKGQGLFYLLSLELSQKRQS